MKKRVLVPIVGQGSIIHIIRTGMLLQLRDFCQPVVALLWQQPDLASELEALGFEVYIIPPYSVSGQYKLVRSQINYWYQCFLLKTPSTGIQKKYLSKFRPGSIVLKQKIKEKLLWLKLKFNQQYINKLVKQEDALLLKEQVYKDYRTWVTSLKIEAIFTVTPFLHEVELIARILRKNSAHLIASIHSFDNVTKRGWPAIFFDDYFVWNKYNKAELERINPALTGHNKITIAGAPQFDFHYNDNYCWSKDQWLERLGLPGNKKIILYSGGSANLIPHEHQYVKDIINALEEGKIAGDAILLFRCHPLDAIQRWLDAIGNSSFFYYDFKRPLLDKLDYNNYTIEDERKLISTLKYTDVHVNLCSTMAVDGSIFNKPQIAPYYDQDKSLEPFLRNIYKQEHYRPIINSGVLNMADSKEKLVSLIAGALQNPNGFNTKCGNCVTEIATYADGKSTARVIAKMKTFF